ncbi:LPS assembly lipoprotein LptE [Neptunicella sp. SCSIO 80796]|uniref:LPS-assembly lipoprotein LptE n=1 Tax=Neptunicella plasticusilytica TaxID=3117012 RepID=UPI003A4DCC32
MCLSLTGCGFKLRGTNSIPAEFQTIQLQGVSQYDPLYRAVKTKLHNHKVTVTEPEDPALPILKLVKDNLERRLLSLFATGQVAEYELVYTVTYVLIMPDATDGEIFEFDIVREYQDDPNAVLAKSRELDLVMKEMRNQAADKIIRQLANHSSQNPQQ